MFKLFGFIVKHNDCSMLFKTAIKPPFTEVKDMGERKRSWREIDKMRDRGGRAKSRERESSESSLEKALKNPRLKQQYLKEVENLFKGAKGRPEHAKDLMALHDAYGTKKFPKLAKKYVKTYGMPDEWGTLMLLLDLEGESQITIEAIEALARLYESKGPVEKKGLKSKLRIISMTSDDPDVRDTAETVLSELD